MNGKQDRHEGEAERYREAARRIYGGHGLSVTVHAAVQYAEDGAFVEALVWVPRGAAIEERHDQRRP